jgi:excinuclease ABC subunit B
LDPVIEVRPSKNQVDDLMEEIRIRAEKDERILVTTLTKRMAEELTSYMVNLGIRCNYIHSDVDTLDRVKILENLRMGLFDVLVGVNLLREGLDLPEVSLVAILDADKEGFLRNQRSLTQTSGRAARNLNGKVIMYADKMTRSMNLTIDETNRRRIKQQAYNEKHHITPTAIIKDKSSALSAYSTPAEAKAYIEPTTVSLVADPVIALMKKPQLEKTIDKARKAMYEASKRLDFLEAAQYRDEVLKLEELLKKNKA